MSKSNKTIFAVVVLVLLCILGYGFYNGSKVKSYAKDVDEMVTTSDAKWDGKDFGESQSVVELKKQMNEAEKEAGDNLLKLDNMKAPGKAKDLERKTKEYFTLVKDAASDTSDFLDYIAAVDKTSNEFKDTSITGSVTDKNSFIRLFTRLHNSLSATLTKLKAITPPPSFRNFHDKYISALERMDSAVVKSLGYAKANQLEKIGSVLPQLEAASQELTASSIPNTEAILRDIITKNEKERLDSLSGQIKKEADELEKTVFSF